MLKTETLKMHEIARKLDLTGTEAFRQLERLSESMLVQKQPEGTYSITNYGRLILQFFPPIEFSFKQRRYFLDHDFGRLPSEFISRFGEISKGILVSEIAEAMNKLEEMIIASEDHVYVITNQVLTVHSHAMTQKLPEGVKFKSIIHERLLESSQLRVPAEKNVERQVLSEIPGILLATEKEAFFTLFTLKGEIGNSGFLGNDPLFLKWINDLFAYYWRLSRKWIPK